MNILLINYAFPPLGGGSANAAKNLARELAVQGNTVTVLTTWYENLAVEENIDHYRVLRIKARRKKRESCTPLELISYCLHAIRASNDIVRRYRIDKTLAFFSIPGGIVSYYLKLRHHIPYIISLRGGDVPGALPQGLSFYYFITKPLILFFWKNAEYTVANSEALQRLAQSHVSPQKVSIQMIPNGIETEVFRPPQSPRNSNPITILMAARFNVGKRIETLIQAARELKSKRIPFKVLIAGDGPFRPKFEQTTQKYKMTDVIEFLGWLERSEMINLYKTVDIFVLMTTGEGMSNAILEAMASGLPILTTPIPANQHLLQGGVNGFFVRDASDLAHRLEKLISDPLLRQRMGGASRRMSLKYSWKTTAELYHKLLSRHVH